MLFLFLGQRGPGDGLQRVRRRVGHHRGGIARGAGGSSVFTAA